MNDRQRAILRGLYLCGPLTAGAVGRRILQQRGRRPDRPALNALRPLERQGYVMRGYGEDEWRLTAWGVAAIEQGRVAA